MAAFIKTKLTSTLFIKELQARRRAFQGAMIAARIQVPSDLQWWYWLEFGTASRQDANAPVTGSGAPYIIKPVNALSLYFPHANNPNSAFRTPFSAPGGETAPGPDDGRFASVVVHPGVRPHPFVRGTLGPIMRMVAEGFAQAAKGGLRPNVFQTYLVNEIMPQAIEMIAESLDAVAPGTREDGRLDGNSAADVFREEAEAVGAQDFSPGQGTRDAKEAAKRASKEHVPHTEKHTTHEHVETTHPRK
jgi:hypothetical protein